MPHKFSDLRAGGEHFNSEELAKVGEML